MTYDEEFVERLLLDGIGYSLENYCSPEVVRKIQSEPLRHAIYEAKSALSALYTVLEADFNHIEV